MSLGSGGWDRRDRAPGSGIPGASGPGHRQWVGGLALPAGAALLLAALVLGGYARGKGDAVVHLLAIPVLGLSLASWRAESLDRLQKTALAVLVAALGLVAIQLLPLPDRIFASLPERARVLAELRSAGLDPAWLPMTLDPLGTVRSGLALLGVLAMWLLCTLMPRGRRIVLVKLAVAAAVPMALLGFVQASQRIDTTGATGLFENRNHYATMMAMLLPFALAAGRQAVLRNTVVHAVGWHAVAVVLLLAAALSFSRMGSLLAVLSGVSALALLGAGKAQVRTVPRHAALAVLAVATAAAGYLASDRLAQRFASNPMDDLRWQYLRIGTRALEAYLPWGSGMGSFREVYRQFEPMESLGEFTFANHAHNELLQNTIEGGLPALVLMLVFVGVVVASALALLRRTGDADHWRRAALVSALVPLIHSLVDYPLRTLACGILLALALAVLLSPTGSARDPTR